jgi:hypothetical protein
MPVTSVDPVVQLGVAVRLAREGRHHDTCTCCLYRDQHRAGFCSMQESRWSVAVSNLLDIING